MNKWIFTLNTEKIYPLAAVLVLVCQPTKALDLNIYGVGHLSVDSVDDGQNSSVYVASNSSRLGLSGGYR